MSEKKNDGGPAFPVELDRDGKGLQTSSYSGWATGMTLRDYFAAQVLVGLGTWMPLESKAPYHHHPDLKSDEAITARAEWAYRQADAMIRARGE